MHIQALYDIFLQHSSVQTDTRKLQPGDIFFALKGPNFNGNLFARQALDAGAACVVVDEDTGFDDGRLFKTDDVLTTMQQLAKHHRQQFTIPFIAITGSNGKTTTKELVHAVLASTYITYTTKGNLNNHIGIPLTLLSVKRDAQFAVIEMGANHQKEIESYCTYTLPTHGIITNCGKAHLEGFGGVEGVRKGKGELYDYLRANGGTVFLMKDYDYLVEMAKGIKEVITYGTADAAVTGRACGGEFLKVNFTRGISIDIIQTNLVGDYNLPNVLVAVSVGQYFNVPDAAIKTAIENYFPSNSRSQLVQQGSNKIILDAYNANPSSMKLAVENLGQVPGDNKILLLGAMAELGEESIAEHQMLLQTINNYTWKAVVLVGGDFKMLTHPYIYFDSATEAAAWLQEQHFENTTILVKGSRSMQMEQVLG
jgi:UDP-N-acetylmuramoyl-tripeptide--D-alanyl-D-alanine ligase